MDQSAAQIRKELFYGDMFDRGEILDFIRNYLNVMERCLHKACLHYTIQFRGLILYSMSFNLKAHAPSLRANIIEWEIIEMFKYGH